MLHQALLNPRRIALIGASTDAARLTARAQLYLRRHGFAGELFPVNPRAADVLGERAYPSLRDVPGDIDFAYVLVNTAAVEAAIEACAERRVPVACVLADGFAEAGQEGLALQRRVLAAAHGGGVRLLGPNSMGIVNVPAATACSVNAALEAERLIPGRWSLVSHSGSVMGTLLSRAAARGFGFAKMIGTGNEADLTAGEIASLLVDDPETDAILLFLETIRRPELYEEAARRAHAAGKPIIAYKLGRSEAGAALATTHTGAIAGSDAATDAFLRACGIARVDMLETLLELPPLLLGARPAAVPKRAVRVVTTTGGGGAMVVDRLGTLGIATARMTDTTLAGARKDSVAAALNEARAAGDCDVAVAVIGSSAQFRPQDAVAGVLASQGPRPLAAFLLPQADASLQLLAEAGVAAFRTPEACADAVRSFLDWRAPRALPEPGDMSAVQALLPAPDEPRARAVFAALGLADAAVAVDPAAPPTLRYPVALKAVSAEIAHKTEAGAVVLNVPDETALRAACAEMRARLGSRISGFIAQPMVRGVAEAILGYRRDPLVGPVIALGAGGVLAEVYRDVVLRMAPVSAAEAMEMIAEVKGLAPARGYRNLPKGDLAALAQAVADLSRLAALPDVREAEVNPLIVLQEGQGVVMADALLSTGREDASGTAACHTSGHEEWPLV
ncbi:acetate--CoA ligase family protein [Limobrevibacterium gyesilva]|uniref:Acetate--CoA ligase family protein n=1 Tax=Limobrevibacterium gyesilva TaxID=2991712 RepID=A0AA41YPZ7_9PROT|nr:acetate--CoA ligase [Limobrevibacterium gyesilva]MCW3476452.1 acetate--CoA ligase family protein [Limobrevibacterium gyesilva]